MKHSLRLDRITYTFFILFSLFFAGSRLKAQVSGNVFRDFNGNGIKDNSAGFNEPFVQGISVKATLADGTAFNATTDAAGAYSFTTVQIPGGIAVRIEFSGLSSGDYPGLTSTGNNTNVQFATAPASAINYSINAPDDYWNNIANPDPTLLVVQHPRGAYNGYNAGRFSVLQINNSTNGPDVAASAFVVTIDTSKRAARFFNTGTIYGMAYQKKQERFFVTAVLKRTFGFGIYGPGGMYFLNKSGTNWNFGGGFNLQGVIPSNSATALDFGTVTRVTSPTTDDNYISGSASGTSKSRDNDAFAKVGTMSIGGVDADAINDNIYLINLFQSRLVVFNGSATNANLNAASAATLAAYTKAYDLTGLPGYPAITGAGNGLRPFGIKVYKGRGYVGVINDALATQTPADLKGYVLSFDLKNITAGFTTEVTIQFNNYTGGTGRLFKPWVNTWAQAGGSATVTPKFCAQPIISDFEFNEDGSMDIAIRDRWGDQNAVDYDAWPSATNSGVTIQQGDVLHACRSGSGWALEGTPGGCAQVTVLGNPKVAPYNPGGFGNSYGNTGKEFYADVAGDGENESSEGSIAKLMGSQKSVFTTYDPVMDGTQPSSNYWNTQGLHWNDNVTGRKTQMARTAVNGTLQVAKVNGMGDIEFVTVAQEIQIGNRVWNDVNGNGIQDAGEKGLNAVAVILRSPGPDGIYNTGDDQSWQATTNANGNYAFDNSNVVTADTRKPANWTGITGILPGYDYQVQIDTTQTALTAFHVTQANVSANTLDNIDNDGTVSGIYMVASINTNFVNQDLDFGFRNTTAIGNFVWDDLDGNGVQNPGETGIAGMVVKLYDNSNNVFDSTATDANGYYSINSIRPANNYYVVFSNLPYGKNFSPQYAGGTSANDNSKTDAFGRTGFFNLSADQIITNLDAGVKAISNVTLPITLLNFTATKMADKAILQWSTATEINSSYTAVERSANGNTFLPIGRIAAGGNRSVTTDYNFTDAAPATAENYYRLKMVSSNGAVQYSAVRLVVFDKNNIISIFPNPTHAQLNIIFPTAWVNRSVSIQLYDESGREVLKKSLTATSQMEAIRVDKLANGLYWIGLRQGGASIEYRKIQVLK